MRRLRLLLALAVLAADGAALVRWARHPAVPLRPGERLAWLRENAEGLVTAGIDGPWGRRVVQAGASAAEERAGQRAEVVAAQLPLMLSPRARRALLLGWGTGAAAGAALSHPLERVDAVEPTRELVEASSWVLGARARTLGDSRLRVIQGRADAYLRAPGPSYDVIVFQAPPDERLLRLARARLSPAGLLAAPARVDSLDGDGGLRQALRRALRQFPSASVWSVVDGEGILLVGQRRTGDVAGLDGVFARAAPAVWLRPLGVSYPATLLSLESADDATARAIAWAGLGPARPFAIDDRASIEGRRRLLLARYLRQRRKPLRPREYLEILLQPRAPAERPVFRGLLEEWVAQYPRDPRALAFLCIVEQQEGQLERAAALRARLSGLRRRAAARIGREIVLPAAGR